MIIFTNKSHNPQPTGRKDNSGVFTMVLIIIGSIVGGGVVSMPYASLQTGIWVSLAINIH